MKGLIETKSVKVFTTGDGKVWDNKDKAAKHQAVLNLRSFFQAIVSGGDATLIVDAIQSDLDGFREIAGPITRKPRQPKEVEAVEADSKKLKAVA